MMGIRGQVIGHTMGHHVDDLHSTDPGSIPYLLAETNLVEKARKGCAKVGSWIQGSSRSLVKVRIRAEELQVRRPKKVVAADRREE